MKTTDCNRDAMAGFAAPYGSASMPGVIQIPANHNVTGTCGECGWPIISPMLWGGTCPPSEWCMNCGKHPKPIVAPSFGPVREMTPNDQAQRPALGGK